MLVLDVDFIGDIVTLSLDLTLIKAAKSKKAATKLKLNPSDTVQGVVQCVLTDRLVLTLPEYGSALGKFLVLFCLVFCVVRSVS